MNLNKMLWEKGDFTRIASTMRESGAALIGTLGVTPEMRVLDLGCGDGTTAVPAAERGAAVLGVDIADNLVAAGNARARAAGLDNLLFRQGDASNLADLEPGSFDLLVSMFGAMFAPSPYQVAKEMVRVTRRGGRIVMGNWIPNDPTLVAQILKASASYLPAPPPDFVSPMLWGSEPDVIDRFATAGVARNDIAFDRDSYTFRYPGAAAAFADLFLDYYGPTMNALAAAEAAGKAKQFRAELRTLFESQNNGLDDSLTEISATFLRVSVIVQ